MKHIVSFSGGKDSTALLIRMLELNMQVDDIVFADTGIEFLQMYTHIKKVEEYIGRPITIVRQEHNYLYYMFDRVKTKGKNKGEKGYMWMDFRSRWCTRHLKKEPINKYLKKYKDFEVVEYIGIASDEIKRTLKNKEGRNILYPLVDWGWTGKDALQYCYNKGFDWDGLYKSFTRLSCYLCPLQRLGGLKEVWLNFPDQWQHMKELDIKNIALYGRKFRSDYSIEELEAKFKTT